MGASNSGVMLPFDPLWDEARRQLNVAAPTITGVAKRMGVHRTQVHRNRRSGLIEAHLADRIAVNLGSHPWALYGQTWIDFVEGRAEIETCFAFAELLADDGIEVRPDKRHGDPRVILRPDAIERLAVKLYGPLWRSKNASSRVVA